MCNKLINDSANIVLSSISFTEKNRIYFFNFFNLRSDPKLDSDPLFPVVETQNRIQIHINEVDSKHCTIAFNSEWFIINDFYDFVREKII